jgi:phytoene dehydrogenase-like protein
MPLENKLSAAIGIMMMVTGHAVGWPIAQRGSQSIAGALASYFLTLGGEIVVNKPITTMADLPPARAYLFDVAPRNLARIAKSHLPEKFVASLERYRYGPGVFKLDWALSRSIPWTNQECLWAATVHVGGTLEEIAESERAAWSDEPATKPFVLVGQQSLFDDTRAPKGQHTGWAYCHVPHGCEYDMTFRIEQQIERFAPGFGDIILARKATPPKELEAGNPNYIGGDITGGVQDLWQLFTRPTLRANPYTTPNESIYICSASTPPGGGVHGMCGFWAAKAALKRAFK